MTELNVMDEDWMLLLSLLPKGWRELARETHALKGLRQDKAEDACLRVLLLHLACGYSLRETAVRAREARVADLSDVAILKRLRKSGNWLQALCRRLLEEQATVTPRVDGLATAAWLLRKDDEESSKAWLYGKLFVALLTERLIQKAESFSPWGYEVAPASEPMSLAGV